MTATNALMLLVQSARDALKRAPKPAVPPQPKALEPFTVEKKEELDMAFNNFYGHSPRKEMTAPLSCLAAIFAASEKGRYLKGGPNMNFASFGRSYEEAVGEKKNTQQVATYQGANGSTFTVSPFDEDALSFVKTGDVTLCISRKMYSYALVACAKEDVSQSSGVFGVCAPADPKKYWFPLGVALDAIELINAFRDSVSHECMAEVVNTFEVNLVTLTATMTLGHAVMTSLPQIRSQLSSAKQTQAALTKTWRASFDADNASRKRKKESDLARAEARRKIQPTVTTPSKVLPPPPPGGPPPMAALSKDEKLPRIVGGNLASKIDCRNPTCGADKACWYNHSKK